MEGQTLEFNYCTYLEDVDKAYGQVVDSKRDDEFIVATSAIDNFGKAENIEDENDVTQGISFT